jgi:hypothetical protein
MSSRIWIAIAFACQLTAQVPARVDLERQLWTAIKQALSNVDGDEYFQSSMKDAMLPRLKGTLISVVPNEGGNALVLGLADSTTPEVALLVHDLPRELAPGASIEFEGVPISFTRDPFLVTFEVDEATKPFGAIAPSWYFGPAMGATKSGRYLNNHTRVEFVLPSDWTVEGTHPSVDNGDVVILKLPSFEGAFAAVWMAREKIRPAGLQPFTTIADHEEGGVKMSESLTWVVTDHTRVLFFARATAYDLPIFQTHFVPIISSAVVP